MSVCARAFTSVGSSTRRTILSSNLRVMDWLEKGGAVGRQPPAVVHRLNRRRTPPAVPGILGAEHRLPSLFAGQSHQRLGEWVCVIAAPEIHHEQPVAMFTAEIAKDK